MELALYCPELGFYEREKDNVGRSGHFYTSVSVGPLFGELLAFQFARWFEERINERKFANCAPEPTPNPSEEGNPQPTPNPSQEGNPNPDALPCGVPLLGGVRGGFSQRFMGSAECGVEHETLQLIEAGAHDGRLACDILNWLRERRPEVFERTQYCIIEPSAIRREWQRKTLAEFSQQLRWHDSFPIPSSDLRPPISVLCFSNELLDAMPVRRFGWDTAKHAWFEWGVATEADRFIWTRMTGTIDPASLGLPTSPELLDVLPDGYTMEISPAAEAWWSAAAKGIGHGRLLTFDYGYGAEESISPGRLNGTLRAYRDHKQVENVLDAPGEQDITAHVDFGRIKRAGETAGLKTEQMERQESFLTRLASETWKPGADFGDWDQKRTRQFQTLTHPQHLGRNFRVLIQNGASNSDSACPSEKQKAEIGKAERSVGE